MGLVVARSRVPCDLYNDAKFLVHHLDTPFLESLGVTFVGMEIGSK